MGTFANSGLLEEGLLLRLESPCNYLQFSQNPIIEQKDNLVSFTLHLQSTFYVYVCLEDHHFKYTNNSPSYRDSWNNNSLNMALKTMSRQNQQLVATSNDLKLPTKRLRIGQAPGVEIEPVNKPFCFSLDTEKPIYSSSMKESFHVSDLKAICNRLQSL